MSDLTKKIMKETKKQIIIVGVQSKGLYSNVMLHLLNVRT